MSTEETKEERKQPKTMQHGKHPDFFCKHTYSASKIPYFQNGHLYCSQQCYRNEIAKKSEAAHEKARSEVAHHTHHEVHHDDHHHASRHVSFCSTFSTICIEFIGSIWCRFQREALVLHNELDEAHRHCPRSAPVHTGKKIAQMHYVDHIGEALEAGGTRHAPSETPEKDILHFKNSVVHKWGT